jgi:hypothetical protein
MLPNFLCIGVQKGGTTTLWDLLRRSPDVYFSDPRETNFFLFDFDYRLGAVHYERTYFADTGGAKAVGEKTPDYLFYPPCAGRIRATLGTDVKFIAVLRSPAARANSHHRHNFMLYRESLSFDEAIQLEASRTGNDFVKQAYFGYMKKGDYFSQIERYRSLFPAENLLLLRFEDLEMSQEATVGRICAFLDVRPPENVSYVSRGRPVPEGLSIARAAEGRHDVHFDRGELIVRDASRRMLTFSRNFERNLAGLRSLSGAEERELNQRHHGEGIRRLGDLLDLDFSHWLP